VVPIAEDTEEEGVNRVKNEKKGVSDCYSYSIPMIIIRHVT